MITLSAPFQVFEFISALPYNKNVLPLSLSTTNETGKIILISCSTLT